MSILVPTQDLAPSLTSRVVTMRFTDFTEGGVFDAERPGSVTFTLPGDLRVQADDIIVRGGSETVELQVDSFGIAYGEIRLPTHDPDAIADGVGSDWYLLVSKSWTQQVDMIRVPQGTTSISLADINPVVEVTPAMGQWLLTNAEVERVDGAQWGITVSVSAGIAKFRFTVPPGGEAWSKGQLAANTDFNTLTTPGTAWNASTTAPNAPVPVPGTLEVLQLSATRGLQRYTTDEATPAVFERRWVGTAFGAWEQQNHRLGERSGSTDLNTLIVPGQIGFNASTAPNQPVPVAGTLEIMRLGTVGVLHRYTTWETTPRVFTRRGSTNGSFPWIAWTEIPSKTQLDAEVAAIRALSSSSSAMKVVPLAVTAPGGTVLEARPSGSARWVRKYAHMPRRVRVHVSNRNPANMSSADAATLLGVRIGRGFDSGRIEDQIDAMPANQTLPVSGSAELVGPWVEVPSTVVDGGLIGITLAWSGGGNVQMLQGGGWVIPDSTTAWQNLAAASTSVRSQMTPFYVWLEAEVPGRVPVLVGNGDSISIGTASTDPVGDSWVAQYALSEGALPVLFSQHGSNSTHWKTNDQRWTSLYPGVQVSPDAIINALGRNDITAGMTLATLQARHNDVRAAYTAMWPRVPVFVSSITPYAGADSAAEAERRLFNTWLRSLPGGARGFFDFAAAVGNAEDTGLAAAYSADGLHPNTAGLAQMAQRVIARPVTPFTPTAAKLRAL